MVVGGSHIYAATMSVAHVQSLSRIPLSPAGDAVYPPWDPAEWILNGVAVHEGFSVETYHRGLREERVCAFDFPVASAERWWSSDWSSRLEKAVAAQRKSERPGSNVNWTAVHAAAMRVIVEAAEDRVRGEARNSGATRSVRLNRHVSMQDMGAIQGALLHWSDYLSPRRVTA